MISINFLTLNRPELLHCVTTTLANANYPYELIITDNGSKPDVIEFIKSLNPDVLILNKENKGIPKMLNTMIHMSSCDYICCLDSDMELPPNWVKPLIEWHQKIPKAGWASIHSVETLHPLNSEGVHEGEKVFGVKFFHKSMVKEVGYFNEEYTPYGQDDSDYLYRMRKLGYRSFYIPNLKANHMGLDVGNGTEYRKMKDEALKASCEKYMRLTSGYDATQNYYVGL